MTESKKSCSVPTGQDGHCAIGFQSRSDHHSEGVSEEVIFELELGTWTSPASSESSPQALEWENDVTQKLALEESTLAQDTKCTGIGRKQAWEISLQTPAVTMALAQA